MMRRTDELTGRLQAESRQTIGRLAKCNEWSSTVMFWCLLLSVGLANIRRLGWGVGEERRECERVCGRESPLCKFQVLLYEYICQSFLCFDSLKKSFAIINDLDSAKFPLLLSRVLQKIHVKEEKTFTEDEEEKLQKALSLESADLQLVVEACEFIFHQVCTADCFWIVSPIIFNNIRVC